MSGICGILHRDGEPVDGVLLQRLTAFLSFRGPDAQRVWNEGDVGFGHTLLRTTFESESEQQPASLDGNVWITADARIDGQAELKEKLRATGRTALDGALDHELILHAYHAWSEDCVHHLIGDFAFAIWDGSKRQLFCARDHFGVKPFFYAQVGKSLVFSNTLDCVRQHPEVSDTLNDLAIADFLLFDGNQEPDTTCFADIRRLPSAHTLVVSDTGVATKRYWSLPTDIPVRYRPKGDYVEHFRHLLEAATADRLRTDRVGVELSGGLDSPAIAAVAKRQLEGSGRPFEINAHTLVYDRLIPDQERHFSGLVAEKLGIPQQVLAADGYGLFERYDEVLAGQPEPSNDPTAIRNVDMLRALPARQRVVLTGWDGDALLNESPKPYFRHLWKSRRYWRLLTDVAAYALWQRRTGPLVWRDWLKAKLARPSPAVSSFPAWLNPEFEQSLGLRARHQQYTATATPHPLRPYAVRNLGFVQGPSSFFDGHDAGQTRLTIDYRHPLMDLRVVEFCLSLPPYPWCVKKHLLREYLRGVVPEAVRTRPKSPLAGDPHMVLLEKTGTDPLDGFQACRALARYVDREKVPSSALAGEKSMAWVHLRPLALNRWLQSRHHPQTAASP